MGKQGEKKTDKHEKKKKKKDKNKRTQGNRTMADRKPKQKEDTPGKENK